MSDPRPPADDRPRVQTSALPPSLRKVLVEALTAAIVRELSGAESADGARDAGRGRAA